TDWPACSTVSPTGAAPCLRARSAGRTKSACASPSRACRAASCATCARRWAWTWWRSGASASAGWHWRRCRSASGATCPPANASEVALSLKSPGSVAPFGELFHQLAAEGRQVLGLAAGDQALVDHHLLVHHFGA